MMLFCGYCLILIVGFDVIGLLVGWLIIYCYYVLLFFPELIVRCFYGDRFYCSEHSPVFAKRNRRVKSHP